MGNLQGQRFRVLGGLKEQAKFATAGGLLSWSSALLPCLAAIFHVQWSFHGWRTQSVLQQHPAKSPAYGVSRN